MKTGKLEQLLSAKKAQELYLSSYSVRAIYQMMETGQLRALFEQRGNRRKWSIPLSAIAEFVARLEDNQHIEPPGLDPFFYPLRRGRTRG